MQNHMAGKPRRFAAYAFPHTKHGVDCASFSTTSDTESQCPCPTTPQPATSSPGKVQRKSESLAMEEALKPSGPTVCSGAAAAVRNSANCPRSASSSNLPCSSRIEPCTCHFRGKTKY